MATDIFDKPINDHAVFDRIVDADRTITLARQAADKAEAEGKAEKAAVLRAKADHLEQILQATQQPDYEDEIESGGQGPDATGGSGGDNGQQDTQDGKNGNSNDSGQAPGSNDTKNGSGGSGAQGTGDGAETPDDSTKGQDSSGSGEGSDDKTPDDISNIDQNTGSHEGGTNKSNQGGPGGGSSGGSGGSGGQGQSQNGNSKSSSNKQKELDPFRRSLGGQGQQETPSPQDVLDAVIKRLSRLSGNAKVGADRALRQLYDQLSDGSEAIDD